jgi:hypothetical protein
VRGTAGEIWQGAQTAATVVPCVVAITLGQLPRAGGYAQRCVLPAFTAAGAPNGPRSQCSQVLGE